MSCIHSRARLLAAVLAVLFLSACSTPLVIVPKDVGDRGLLVAQVSSQTMAEALSSDPVIRSPNDQGRLYTGGLRGGTLIVPLPPGEYELTQLSRMTGSSSISTGYGTIHQTSRMNYPVGRTFTIEAGKATTLGMLVFERSPEGGDRYLLMYADNRKELERFLRERYESTYLSLRGERFIAADVPQLAPEGLHQLRRYLAADRLAKPQWQFEHPDAQFVTASFGAAARVVREPGRPPAIGELIETGTVADLSGCSIAGARVACVTGAHHYLLLEDDQMREVAAPDGVTVNSIHVFAESGIVIVDDDMRFHNSQDGGRSWQVYDGVRRAKPFRRDGYRRAALNNVTFVPGRNGFYAFERGVGSGKGSIVHADHATATYRTIPVPGGVSSLNVLQEASRGLYVGPNYSLAAKGRAHFLPAGENEWAVLELPASGCSDLRVAEDTVLTIDVSCAGGVYRSEDGGTSWSPLLKAQSLFR